MKIDSSSDTWIDIEKWANGRIAELREQNDSDLNKVDTANIRGHIEFAKELLALTEKPVPIVEVGANHYLD